MPSALGNRLSMAMAEAGLGNPEIAEAAGVHPGTVSAWRNGRITPSDVSLERVATRLGKPVAWLKYGAEDGGRVADEGHHYSPNPRFRRLLPPRAYARMYEYLQRLEAAGADAEQLEEAERIMADVRYSKLNKRTGGEPTEDEILGDVDAGWAWVWELATRGGLQISGPRPDFEEG